MAQRTRGFFEEAFGTDTGFGVRPAELPQGSQEAYAPEARSRPPSVVEVIGRGEAHYTFVPIFSELTLDDGVYKAKFWVLDDALKWKVPNASSVTTLPQAADFDDTSHDDVMVLKHGRRLRDVRRRLWRLPCSAREAEDAARLIRMRQRQLPGAEAEFTSRWSKKSLLLTPHLYNLRYEQADLKVRPQTGLMGMNARQGLTAASLEHNRRVTREAHRVHNSNASGPRLYPELLADPGKIWAIHHRMGKVRKITCEKPKRPTHFRVAVNHGWHKSTGRRWQNSGTCHDASHSDYSQILLVVAGWCEFVRPGRDPKWVRTWRLYRSKKYGALVTGGGPRLKKIRYNW